jgi:hypothetical protein
MLVFFMYRILKLSGRIKKISRTVFIAIFIILDRVSHANHTDKNFKLKLITPKGLLCIKTIVAARKNKNYPLITNDFYSLIQIGFDEINSF